MSGGLRGGRAIRICQRLQGPCECRFLLWRHAGGSRRPARGRGQAHASREAAPRQRTGCRGFERLDRRRLPRYPAASHTAKFPMKKAIPIMKAKKSGSKEGKAGDSASKLIDARIE